MAASWIIGFLVSASLLNFSECQNCQGELCCVEYSMAPSTLSSPLNCSIEGREVTITCQILSEGGVALTWHRTTNRSQAGTSVDGTRINGGNNGYTIPPAITTSSTLTSMLTIASFDNSLHNGFYWCERDSFTGNEGLSVLPSPIVNIQNCPWDEQCIQTTFDFSSSITKCAFGDVSLRNITVVPGIDCVNTTIPMTTANMTIKTANMTITTPATTFVMEEPTERGCSTKCTITIWFAGSVAMILIYLQLQ